MPTCLPTSSRARPAAATLNLKIALPSSSHCCFHVFRFRTGRISACISGEVPPLAAGPIRRQPSWPQSTLAQPPRFERCQERVPADHDRAEPQTPGQARRHTAATTDDRLNRNRNQREKPKNEAHPGIGWSGKEKSTPTNRGHQKRPKIRVLQQPRLRADIQREREGLEPSINPLAVNTEVALPVNCATVNGERGL